MTWGYFPIDIIGNAVYIDSAQAAGEFSNQVADDYSGFNVNSSLMVIGSSEEGLFQHAPLKGERVWCRRKLCERETRRKTCRFLYAGGFIYSQSYRSSLNFSPR